MSFLANTNLKGFRSSYVVVFLCFIGITSCITNKKILYLQNDIKNNTQLEIVERDMEMKLFDNVLKPKDIIGIDFVSINKDNFNYGLNTSGEINKTQTGYTIDDSGYVEVPFIGKILMKGLTISKAKQLINAEVAQVYPHSYVNVYQINFFIYLMGEFIVPGKKAITDDRINIYQLLSEGSDITKYGNKSKVKIIRTVDGKTSVIKIDVRDRSLITSEVFFLKPGDIIYVEPLSAKVLIDNTILITLLSFGLSLSITIVNIILVLSRR